tara:strand:- start:761 stop:1129 length:369 start_codon:yes stop_codon:yes gene_type:complete
MVKIITRPQSVEFQRLIEKSTALQETSKAVDTDWFAANISATNSPANHRLYIRLATSSVVNLQMDDGTNTDLEMNLNNGNSLTANSLYAFDIIVPAGYSYNLQHKTGTQNINAWIVEGSVLS